MLTTRLLSQHTHINQIKVGDRITRKDDRSRKERVRGREIYMKLPEKKRTHRYVNRGVGCIQENCHRSIFVEGGAVLGGPGWREWGVWNTKVPVYFKDLCHVFCNAQAVLHHCTEFLDLPVQPSSTTQLTVEAKIKTDNNLRNPSSLASLNPRMAYLPSTGLPRLSCKGEPRL